jgi:hypothetical protein
MLALTLALALPAAGPKPVPNPRQVTEKYVAALLADKPDDAVRLAVEGTASANPDKVRKYRAALGVAKLAFPTVLFSAEKGVALVVSEEIPFPKTDNNDLDRGVVLITLKKNKDGVWQVKDVDARKKDEADALLKKARELLKDAKDLPPTKS